MLLLNLLETEFWKFSTYKRVMDPVHVDDNMNKKCTIDIILSSNCSFYLIIWLLLVIIVLLVFNICITICCKGNLKETSRQSIDEGSACVIVDQGDEHWSLYR